MIYLIIFLFVTFLSITRDGRYEYNYNDNADEIDNAEGELTYIEGYKSKDNAYWLVYLIIVCLLGFSRDLGGDKMLYIDTYKYYKSWNDGSGILLNFINNNALEGKMYLWSLLNITAKTISPDSFTFLQFIHAAFVNGVFFWFFKNYSNCKYLCLLVYFIFAFFNLNCEVMRESISVAIFMLAYPCFERKQWIKYYILAVIALGFHLSACIMLILPFVPNIHIKKTTFLLFILFGLFLYYTVDKYLMSFSLLLEGGDTSAAHYANHLNKEGNLNAFLFWTIKFVIVPYICVYLLSKYINIQNSKIYNMINRYFIIAPIITSIILLNRFFNYFSIFSVILFANLIYSLFANHKSDLNKIISICFVVFVFYFGNGYYQKYNIYYRYDLYFPYTSIFDEEPTQYRNTLHDITLYGE